MSLAGTGSNSSYWNSFPPISAGGAPHWISLWYAGGTIGQGSDIAGIGAASGSANQLGLVANDQTPTLTYYATGTVTTVPGATNFLLTNGTWQHLLIASYTTSSHEIFCGGVSAGNNTTANVAVTADRFKVHASTLQFPQWSLTNRYLAEVVFGAGSLTPAQVLSLAQGRSPLAVAPAQVIAYYPLKTTLVDIGPVGYPLTQVGTFTPVWNASNPVVDAPPVTGGGTATTWNPADKNAGITLTNGNLTATGSAGAGTTNQAVRGTAAVSASVKQYFEVKATQAARYWFAGVMSSSASVTNGDNVGQTNGICFGNLNAGSAVVYRNGVALPTTYTTVATGDVIRVAVDRVANKIWFAINNTAWVGVGTRRLTPTPTIEDPATGTGGADISVVTGTIYPAWSSAYTGDAATINGGAAAFAFAVPAGFVGIDTGAVVSIARRPRITVFA
jgi:hypothetical protein